MELQGTKILIFCPFLANFCDRDLHRIQETRPVLDVHKMLGEEHRSPLSGCRVRCLGTEGSTPEVAASSVSTAVGSGDSHTLDSTSSWKRIQNAKGHLDKG